MNKIILVFSIFLFLSLLFRHFILIVTVKGNSMSPFLNSDDQVLIIKHWPCRFLRKGDIVVTKLPQESILDKKENYLIKRIIGMPKEKIITRITDMPLFLRNHYLSFHNSEGERLWIIPDNHYFIKGDSFGVDSTAFGPIESQCIIGVFVRKMYTVKHTF